MAIGRGGGERTVLSEAIGLRKRGFEVEVYAPTVSPECHSDLTRTVAPSELAGWLPHRVPYRNYLGMLATSLLSSQIAKRFRDFDCVVAHSQPSYWLASQIKRAYRVPYVAFLHQANRFLYPGTWIGWWAGGQTRTCSYWTRCTRESASSSAWTLPPSPGLTGFS